MKHRRTFLRSLWAGLLAAPPIIRGQPKKNHADVVRLQPLSGVWEGWEAEFNVVTAAPGPGYAPHRHGGFVLGYVLEGEFRFAIEGQKEEVLRSGASFFEPSGVLHTVAASADPAKNAKVLAIIVRPKQAVTK
jgi:quercetin dioxygenase-like cupin family protein